MVTVTVTLMSLQQYANMPNCIKEIGGQRHTVVGWRQPLMSDTPSQKENV